MTSTPTFNHNCVAVSIPPPEHSQPRDPLTKLELRHDSADLASEAPSDLMRSYVKHVVDMLAQMDIGSPEYSSEACQRDFHHLYLQTTTYFAQPSHKLAVDTRTAQTLIQTMVRFVSYCWPGHSLNVKKDLCILFVYYGVLDDWYKDNLTEGMQHFSKDMIKGLEQKNTWWQASIKAAGSNNMTFKVSQALTTILIFSADSTGLIPSIAAVISEVEQWELYVNDLLITSSNNALVKILPHVDPEMETVVRDLMSGYTAFHFTDARYRMSELVEHAENLGLEGAQELRRFYEIAQAGGDQGPSRWAVPSLQELTESYGN
ncbi:unnamed protein product [Aureobasidium mustum]|uniref:Terpenoid synthase n=1 Tax=Aureobasidium mustum TaxID=2773714 RepID=A0A9N8K557_9PEZI|nr:unnamed protein product [Aureobasidium mustum]